jgi:hypothetical protein
MTEEDLFARFPPDIGIGPRRAARKTIAAARERGVLAPDDDVQAVAQLVRYNPAIVLLFLVGLIPGFVAMLGFQRQCFLLVTAGHVVFTRWTLYGGPKAVAEPLRLERPIQLALSEQPKKSHFFGNRVVFPPEVAQFLGKDAGHAQFGNAADEAFRIARTPPVMSE